MYKSVQSARRYSVSLLIQGQFKVVLAALCPSMHHTCLRALKTV